MVSAVAFSDASLYEAITQNKTWALSALYDRYATVLYSLALNILNREKAAQEVVEETFVTVWRKSAASSKSIRNHVATWLVLLCRTLAVSRLRTQMHLAAPAVAIDQLSEWVATFANGHPDAPFDSEVVGLLRETIAQMPPQQRTMLEMVFLKGMTPIEIATSMHLATEEVQAQVHHALVSMREQLAHA